MKKNLKIFVKLYKRKNMTALELAYEHYNRYEDKIYVTQICNALFSVEDDFIKRNTEGYKIIGEFKKRHRKCCY